MQGRTVLVIAHRLSTVRNAGRIVILKQGRIVEIGDHKDLMSRKGEYYRLYQTQHHLEGVNLRSSVIVRTNRRHRQPLRWRLYSPSVALSHAGESIIQCHPQW